MGYYSILLKTEKIGDIETVEKIGDIEKKTGLIFVLSHFYVKLPLNSHIVEQNKVKDRKQLHLLTAPKT